jgi:hypothetical protein
MSVESVIHKELQRGPRDDDDGMKWDWIGLIYPVASRTESPSGLLCMDIEH